MRPTLLPKVGKLVTPARLNAVAAGMLVHITDQLTDGRYLVDTGASFSLVPHKSSAPPATEPRLTGPNGSHIRCWGEERRQLRFSGRTFQWSFLRADVSFPILGVDFLRSNKLLVDVANNTLVDSTTGDTLRLTRQPSGHTASVMLPATLPRLSYAQAAAAAATRIGDSSSTKADPGRVKSWVCFLPTGPPP